MLLEAGRHPRIFCAHARSRGKSYYSQESKAGMLCNFNKLQFPIARQSWYIVENKAGVERLGKAGM